MQLKDNTLTQLYAKLELHLRDIDCVLHTPIPSAQFNDEKDRAWYILQKTRNMNAVAQAIQVKLTGN